MGFDVAGGRFSGGNRRSAGSGAAAGNANGTATASATPGEESERTGPVQRGDRSELVDQDESTGAARSDTATREGRGPLAEAGRPAAGVTRRQADRAPNAVDHYSMVLQLIQVFPIISGALLFALPSVWAARAVSAAGLVGGSVWAVFWERSRAARRRAAADTAEAADGEELRQRPPPGGFPRGAQTGAEPGGGFEGELVLPAQAHAGQARILNHPVPPNAEGIQILISMPLPGDFRVSPAPPRPSADQLRADQIRADQLRADRRSRRRDARNRRPLG